MRGKHKADSKNKKSPAPAIVGRAEDKTRPAVLAIYSQLLALEPRLVFDAAIAVTVDAVSEQMEAAAKVSGEAGGQDSVADSDVDPQSGLIAAGQNRPVDDATEAEDLLRSLAALGRSGIGPLSLDLDLEAEPGLTADGLRGTEDEDLPIIGLTINNGDASEKLTVSFAVDHGSVSLKNAANHSGLTVSGDGSSILTLTGQAADLNAAISANDVIYIGARDLNGDRADTLTVTVTDSSDKSIERALEIHLDEAADAPVISVGPSLTGGYCGLMESTITLDGLQIVDPDNNTSKIFTVTLESHRTTPSRGGL